MGNNSIERRCFKRKFFSMDSGPSVHFSVSGSPDKEFVAEVMNLSEGGLGLIARPLATLPLCQGLQLLIKTTEGKPDLTFLIGEKLELRWFLDDAQIPHIGLGCMFLTISDENRQKLLNIITTAHQEHLNNI